MRVAVLEWITGGGMHAIDPREIPHSLLSEGKLMLECLAEQLLAAGHQVSTTIDRRISGDLTARIPGCKFVDLELTRDLSSISQGSLLSSTHQSILECWTRLAQSCDISILIAPEIDGILQACVDCFCRQQLPVINCRGAFLSAACDKHLGSTVLQRHGIPHPLTYRPIEFCNLSKASDDQLWCLKPSFGAGCDGIQVGDARTIAECCSQLVDDQAWIVQPWMDGEAMSCNGIADSTGKVHWFPLTSQKIGLKETSGNSLSPMYQGGRLLLDDPGLVVPTELLDATIQAIRFDTSEVAVGWIGIDLLKDRHGQWTVIEINPRITTALIALSRSSRANLAERLLEGYVKESLIPLEPNNWQPAEFLVGEECP